MNGQWSAGEVAASTLPDCRLRSRLAKMLIDLSQAPERSIPGACANWSDTLGIYRFLDNSRVTASSILSGHRQSTLERIGQESLVFITQDTVDISVSRQIPLEFGTLVGHEVDHHYLHVSAAFTASRVNLGVVKNTCWQREGVLTAQQRRRPERRPLEERESMRWVEHYADACAIQAQCPQTTVVMLADREGDLHDMFDYAQQQPEQGRANYIVRAKSNRRTVAGLLWEQMQQAPTLGTIPIGIGRRGNKPARTALVALRGQTLTLTASKNYRRTPVTIQAVYAREINPPGDVQPIDWMLITSLDATTFEEARTIVQWYSLRWEIEIFFRVLKQGCHIEALRLHTRARMQNALAVYLIVAWRVHLITMLSRAHPASPASTVFTDLEWRTIYLMQKKKAPPADPPCLRDTARQLAQLGGFLARKGDGEPGVQAFWFGYQRLMDYIAAQQTIEYVARGCV